MGRYMTKRMFLLLTLIMLLPLLISSSISGEPVNSNKNGVFISGRFPSSESEEKLPKIVSDLEFEACCSASRIFSSSKAVESLETYGEGVKDCLDLFKLLECSGTLRICASFCDRVFEACSDAYFSTSGDDANDQFIIVPCGASESIICGKASKWESNGTAFCNAMGFTVQSTDDSAEETCYGSKSSLESPPLIKTEKSAWFQLVKIYWLVTVIVLRTICWLEIRGRYQRQMRALVQRERVVRNMNGIA
ncbi:unnamed protein product [Eruca vesicaria subsp. sativa]|uniref:Folate receptor-like domain-containing protein n=1 Tax=Eruca vesicaria subsp. sativa TaxID=29727 RepID=A0ABC8KDG0_ERUVS|nr:unnamed protein product [Eruca vesicaria subsp. sativa]